MGELEKAKELEQKRRKAKELVALFGAKFHGSITIHVANGEPKKLKTELTEDI